MINQPYGNTAIISSPSVQLGFSRIPPEENCL